MRGAAPRPEAGGGGEEALAASLARRFEELAALSRELLAAREEAARHASDRERLAELEEGQVRLAADLAACTDRCAERLRLYEATLAERDRHRAAEGRHLARVQAARGIEAALRADLEAERAARRAAERAWDEAQARAEALERSRAWRATAPIRRAAALLRR